MLTQADEEAGALIPAAARPPRPPAPAAQLDLCGPHVVIGPGHRDAIARLGRFHRLADKGATPHPVLNAGLWCLMHGVEFVSAIGDTVTFRDAEGAAYRREIPRVDLDVTAAFAFLHTIAPGWLFVSLQQDLTRQIRVGDLVAPTGRWCCKLQVPEGGRLRIGQGNSAALSIVFAALDARLDDLTRDMPWTDREAIIDGEAA